MSLRYIASIHRSDISIRYALARRGASCLKLGHSTSAAQGPDRARASATSNVTSAGRIVGSGGGDHPSRMATAPDPRCRAGARRCAVNFAATSPGQRFVWGDDATTIPSPRNAPSSASKTAWARSVSHSIKPRRYPLSPVSPLRSAFAAGGAAGPAGPSHARLRGDHPRMRSRADVEEPGHGTVRRG